MSQYPNFQDMDFQTKGESSRRYTTPNKITYASGSSRSVALSRTLSNQVPTAPAVGQRALRPQSVRVVKKDTNQLQSTLSQARRPQAPSYAHVATVMFERSGYSAVKPCSNVNGSVYNPSIGPTPSMVSMTAWKASYAASSHASGRSVRQGVYTEVCRISNYTRRNFNQGDIIAIPFHTANTNPNVNPSMDEHWARTIEGPVYSKRRMVVVLWIYQQDMFCLPLFSWNKTGISGKPQHLRHEYVAMKNVGDGMFKNQGMYPPVEVVCYRKPIDKDTTVHISGGVRVGCNEDITWAGRLTRESYVDLIQLWKGLSAQAQKEPWRD